jgi:hypothetical protein
MKRVLLVILAAGCAQGGRATSDAPWGSDADTVDSPRPIDAPEIDARVIDAPMIDAPPPIDAMIDAPPPIDAMIDASPPIDAMIDAPIMVDAPIDAPMVDAPIDAPCVPVVTQLLVNPAFDQSPAGTGWTSHPIDSGYPIVTGQDGPPEVSAPYKAWLGGITSGSDYIYQQVTIPPNTTKLELGGYWFVGSEETTSTSVYDTALLMLTTTGNTTIQIVGGFNNLNEVAAWQPFLYTFPQDLSGQTVRLRIESDNDSSYETSFWFDSFALKATHCP